MPAQSVAQRRFMGMVHAYNKGTLKHPSKEIRDAAGSMSDESVLHFAKTKEKDLPERKEANWAWDGAKWIWNRAWPDVAGFSMGPLSRYAERKGKISPGTADFLDMAGDKWVANDLLGKPFARLGGFGFNKLFPGGVKIPFTGTRFQPPAWSGVNPNLFTPLRGLGGAVLGTAADKLVNENIQKHTGLAAPEDLNAAVWEAQQDGVLKSMGKSFLRSIGDSVSNAAGGGVVSGMPGAVVGAVVGGFKEPWRIFRMWMRQKQNLAELQSSVNRSMFESLVDPRIPLQNLGAKGNIPGYESLPKDVLSRAMAIREMNAQNMQSGKLVAFDMKPRSSWADPNNPTENDVKGISRPAEPVVENRVNPATGQINLGANASKMNSSDALALKGIFGAQALKNPAMLAGGILAGGLGAWGIKKMLFDDPKKKKESPEGGIPTPSIAPPMVPKLASWMLKSAVDYGPAFFEARNRGLTSGRPDYDPNPDHALQVAIRTGIPPRNPQALTMWHQRYQGMADRRAAALGRAAGRMPADATPGAVMAYNDSTRSFNKAHPTMAEPLRAIPVPGEAPAPAPAPAAPKMPSLSKLPNVTAPAAPQTPANPGIASPTSAPVPATPPLNPNPVPASTAATPAAGATPAAPPTPAVPATAPTPTVKQMSDAGQVPKGSHINWNTSGVGGWQSTYQPASTKQAGLLRYKLSVPLDHRIPFINFQGSTEQPAISFWN